MLLSGLQNQLRRRANAMNYATRLTNDAMKLTLRIMLQG